MSSQPLSIPQYGLYIPIQKRSPSTSGFHNSSSGSWRKGRGDSDTREEEHSPQRITYSIPELLRLSASPLARLSRQQERALHDILYLASSWKHPKPSPNSARALPSNNQAPIVVGNPAALYSRPQLNRRRSSSVRRNAADLAVKRSRGRGYGVHPTAVQSNWRISYDEYPSVVTLGARLGQGH